MRLSVSNIAWRRDEEWVVADALAGAGISGVEIAPPRVWDAPASVSVDDASAMRQQWSQRGLRVVALQSLLYGRPDLTIFGDATARAATLAYLHTSISLARVLGAHALVFGSPANRRVGSLAQTEAFSIASDFFSALGEASLQAGVSFCIEPNPAAYGCDFLRTTSECVEFLAAVDAPGLGLHLDAGALTLNEEPIEAALSIAAQWLRHFHISEPYLGMIGAADVPHAALATALAAIGYAGWVSIEMRAGDDASTQRVISAVETAKRLYAPLLAAASQPAS